MKNPFLHGELQEVYMEQPPGYVAEGEAHMVCKLHKSIYGLKQSPRARFEKFSSIVLSFEFVSCISNYSVFVKKSIRGCIILAAYVDDIVISGSDVNRIQETKAWLQSKLQIKDLGKLQHFLGIEVSRQHEGIFLSQKKYIMDMLGETGLTGANSVDTRLETGVKLDPNEGEDLDNPSQFRRLVGKLICLIVTRPDLSFVVSLVSQFIQNPKVPHMNSALRILKYLEGSWHRTLVQER